ncbi:MAG: UPF0182 protein [Dehalococcoidia bacterium]|nr:MAG: UPF0182 protein [Dehalococcoidia bacterium]
MTTFDRMPGPERRASRLSNGQPTGCLRVGGIAALVVAALAVVLALASGQVTDYLWFEALGYSTVFLTAFVARWLLMLGSGALAFLFVLANLIAARRIGGPRLPSYIPREEMIGPGAGPNWAIVAAAAAIALVVALVIGSEWATVLLGLYAEPFGLADPVFGNDIGFYFFTLPLLRLLHGGLIALAVLTLGAVGTTYVILLAGEGLRAALSRPVLGHVSALGAFILLLIAGGYWLDRFDLLFSVGRAVYGAGYTDVNVRLPALSVLSAIVTVGAFVLLANIWIRALWPLAVTAGVWVTAALVLLGIWPAAVQRFVVEPSELSNELPYIERNIAYTRHAFGLDAVDERPFNPRDELTAADVARNSQTLANLRLWDYRFLRDTYNQIQSIRLYYEFPDIDVDRYVINGQLRQVMLGARELVQSRLPDRAQNWVTRRLQFTHGYGIAMSTSNEVTAEGLPRFLVRDVPPIGEIPVTRPGIYFGERTDSYIIVDSTQPDLEFDYPRGEENVSTQFSGGGGVRLDQPWKRLLFAWRFADGNILLSQYIDSNSQILFARNIRERLARLAPFLVIDPDPYLVVENGRLVWMLDGYTIADQFPYGEPLRRGDRTIGYIRNSVKATIDAYDGSVILYLADPSDPLIRAWSRIFPGLIRPMAEMPDGLKAHRRYPELIFTVQATMYQTYHMTDPQVFYNREDQWSIPTDVYGVGNLPMEPYYVILRIPGETREEFVQILPYTPNRRDNMIAWIAARSDGDQYGKLVAIRFPKDRLVFGPAQIGARINQDPVISSQFALWNQQGTKVGRGNLLVIPIEQTLLYIEPIYLQAERSQLPELKRVVLATATRVVMEPTFEEALARLFDGARPATTPPTGSSTPAPPVSSDVAALVRSAQQHYDRAQERLRAGDFAGFGEELRLLEADLRRLGELTAPR